MGRLRMTPHSEKIVTEWMTGAAPEDRQRVEELLALIEGKSGASRRFYSYEYSADPTITVFEPREGLFVLVRMWADDPPDNLDQFDVVTIVDAEDLDDA